MFTDSSEVAELESFLADSHQSPVKPNKDGSSIILPDTNLALPDDFDVRALMDSMEDPVTGTIRDLSIDDRHLPVAKNFYDYSYRIIGKDANPPWAVQMWTGLMLFGEVCPCCSDPKWLDVDNIDKNFNSEFITEHLALLDNGVCKKCKRTKWDLIKNYGLNDYQQLVNCLGQRAGKSSSAAMYCSYMTHKYLMFPGLASLAPNDMQASTELTGTFVSLTLGKAFGLLWVPYKKIIENSKWFKAYFDMLDEYKERNGKELYRNNTLFLSFFHRNLKFYPSGPKSQTLRGDTRLFAVLDELGLFPLPKGDAEEDEHSDRANADEAHKSLARSLTTVQGVRLKLLKQGYQSVPSSLLLNVSSPIAQRDKMMRLLRQSRTQEGSKFLLGVNRPTWEINPTIDRDHPAVVAAYLDNRETAERDYAANPPSVHSQFVPRNAIEHEVFVGGQNSHNFKYVFDTPGQIYMKLERIRTVKWPSVLTIDAGHVNNSFTIVSAHYDFDKDKTVVSTVLECMPQEGRSINFNLLYQHVILPVAKDTNAVVMLADQWQGLDLLYRIQDDMGNNPQGKPRCKAKQWSPRRKDFDAVVSMLQARNVILPTLGEEDKQKVFDGNIADYRVEMLNKPVPHLFLQLYTIQDIGVGRAPQKGEGYTDDIARAMFLGVAKLHDPKVMDRLREAKDWVYGGSGGKGSMPMPAFAGRSGGRLWGLR